MFCSFQFGLCHVPYTFISFPAWWSGVDQPLASSAEVKELVKLYICSPTGPSWRVLR
jgi:hypothetical protein